LVGIDVGKLLIGEALVSKYPKFNGREGDSHVFKFGQLLNDVVIIVSGIIAGVFVIPVASATSIEISSGFVVINVVLTYPLTYV
jgi:hypothetical protein